MSHLNRSFPPPFHCVVEEPSYAFDCPESDLNINIHQQWMSPASYSAQHQRPSPSVSIRTVVTAPDPNSIQRPHVYPSSRSPLEDHLDPNLPDLSLLVPPGHVTPSTYNPIARHFQDQPWSAGNLRSSNAASSRGQFNHSNAQYGLYRGGPGSDIDSNLLASDSGYHSQPPQSVFSNEPSRNGQEIPPSITHKVGNLNVEPNPSESTAILHMPSDQLSQISSRSGKSGKTGKTGKTGKSFQCPECGEISKCKSSLKKHILKHDKPFRCEVPNCKRGREGGFTTINDLDRHKKSVHRLGLRSKSYQCASETCRNKEKIWPRLDNFKQHVVRMHKDEDELDLIKRSIYQPREPAPTGDDAAVGVMDTSLAVAGMEKSFSSNPAMDAVRTLDLSIDQDARRWSSFNQNPEAFAKDVYQMSSQFSEPVVGSILTRPKASKEAPGQSYVYQRALGAIIRRSSKSIITNAEVPGVSGKRATEKQEQMSRHSLSSAPQTKAEQQRSALKKLSQAITGEIKALSSAEPVDLEDMVLRILHRATNSVKWDDRSPQESSNPKNLVTLTKGEALKASQAISNLIRQSPGSVYTIPRRSNPGFISTAKFCPKCDYVVGRDCDLRKHMKRHEKPYGCTYPKCHKRFGAKSDWKRHENSQHFQLETFRCTQPSFSSLETVCGLHFIRAKQFEEHLSIQHDVSEPELLQDELRMCKIGKNCQERFWCGFCKRVTELKERRNAAWDERFDHIAFHFEKEKISIDDWICVEENKPKRDLLKDMDGHVFDEEEEERNMDFATGEKEDVVPPSTNMVREQSRTTRNHRPPPPQLSQPSQGMLSNKRKRTDGYVLSPSKRERITTRYCCQCSAGPWEKPFNLSCMGCSHRLCGSCSEEVFDVVVDGDM